MHMLEYAQVQPRGGGGGSTLGIYGWGCAPGTLEPLTNTMIPYSRPKRSDLYTLS